MVNPFYSPEDDVRQLLMNAELRNALEPYYDEAVAVVDDGRLPTSQENDFLASMLAWECAPILPLSRWFEPELKLPDPGVMDDEDLQSVLHDTIWRLYQRRIILEFTDHLSDRQLYCSIYRDVLPAPSKKLDLPGIYLFWRFLDPNDESETWLRFYATEGERKKWSLTTGKTPPASERPPFPRELPSRLC